jgi:hypothetical protein
MASLNRFRIQLALGSCTYRTENLPASRRDREVTVEDVERACRDVLKVISAWRERQPAPEAPKE